VASTLTSEFTYRRRVEFADTDAAGLIHFTALFRYVEEAEHALYRSLGGAAFERTDSGFRGMPRVAANLEFLGPVRYADEVDVRLVLREKRPKVLRYEAEVRVVGDASESVVARGAMTVVCAAKPDDGSDWAGTELPASLYDQLEVAPDP
jgi:acyl-CoA thioester hydrolase